MTLYTFVSNDDKRLHKCRLTRGTAWVAVVFLCGAIGAARPFAQTVSTTVWNGVFSTSQADRGQAVYHNQCASCHLDTLGGADRAPGLVGEAFQTEWNDLSVGDFFERIRLSMPEDSPMTLPRQAYVDVVAFILKANGFPSGATDLSTDLDTMKAIKIVKRSERE